MKACLIPLSCLLVLYWGWERYPWYVLFVPGATIMLVSLIFDRKKGERVTFSELAGSALFSSLLALSMVIPFLIGRGARHFFR